MRKTILIGVLLFLISFVIADVIDIGIIPKDETLSTNLNDSDKAILNDNLFTPYWNGTIETEHHSYYGYFFVKYTEKPYRVLLFNNFDKERYWSYANGETRLKVPFTLEELINDRMKEKQDKLLKKEIKKIVPIKVAFDVGIKDVSLK